MDKSNDTSSTIATLDLGSNSFHMLLASASPTTGLRVIEQLGEKVQLAAGITDDFHLDDAAMQRGFECLQRLAQLIKGLPEENVRIVATNAVRIARNRKDFITRAEAILGYTVEVISGREEARLIYLGVTHSLPPSPDKRLVVDIGGGSTEFIIGRQFDSLLRESLQMGCVSYSRRFFPDNRITPNHYAQAYTAARLELMSIEQDYRQSGWQDAIGSSGTIKAIGRICKSMNLSNGEITREGVITIKQQLLKLGDACKLDVEGVKSDRILLIPAGLAIVEAVFDAFSIERMQCAEGALREGMVYDLLGRQGHEDVREQTIHYLQARYQVDIQHAARVSEKALAAFDQVEDAWNLKKDWCRDLLRWAAEVHEIGLDIAHYQYHKHGAYILENSDLVGFSNLDQKMLAFLVRAQRRNIPKDKLADFQHDSEILLRLCILLRFAILFHHIRNDQHKPDVHLSAKPKGLTLTFPEGWLKQNPLIRADFSQEAEWLTRINYTLGVK